MSLSLSNTWRERLIESTLIVLSILLAFGIDAWWDGRSIRQAEERALAGLTEDFSSHLAVLNEGLETNKTIADAAKALHDLMGPSAVADSSAMSLAGTTQYFAPVDLQGGTLESLTGSAGIQVIRSEELRVALIEWQQLEIEVAEYAPWFLVAGEKLLDYLFPRIPTWELDKLSGLDLPIDESLLNSSFETNLTPLMRDQEFSNLVYQQYFGTTVYMIRLQNLKEQTELVLQLLAED